MWSLTTYEILDALIRVHWIVRKRPSALVGDLKVVGDCPKPPAVHVQPPFVTSSEYKLLMMSCVSEVRISRNLKRWSGSSGQPIQYPLTNATTSIIVVVGVVHEAEIVAALAFTGERHVVDVPAGVVLLVERRACGRRLVLLHNEDDRLAVLCIFQRVRIASAVRSR